MRLYKIIWLIVNPIEALLLYSLTLSISYFLDRVDLWILSGPLSTHLIGSLLGPYNLTYGDNYLATVRLTSIVYPQIEGKCNYILVG
jgi:hypothetical protein